MLKPDGIYFAYLRKSREDREAELHGEGETLARHEKILDSLADRYHISISQKYKEVVSGETIASRPEMLRMLNDIEELRPDGVLVTEIPRLARGDTKDQGLIMETFKYSGTKIITPVKIYDPNNEFDEEYAEFGLFMSRREYATIKRRLINGKIASAKEGKYTGSRMPYGYEQYKLPNEKGYSLSIVSEQAEVVRLIFEMYVNGTRETGNKPSGATAIASALDRMHIAPLRAEHWSPGVIRGILTNCVYAGYIRWGRRKAVKFMQDGQVKKSHPVQQDFLMVKGRHEPIIDEATWEKAQKMFQQRTRRPSFLEQRLQNSLAGILYCGNCHRAMVRRPAGSKDKNNWFICPTKGCSTSGVCYELVEQRVVASLSQWLESYKIQTNSMQTFAVSFDALHASLASHLASISTLSKQLDKIYTLLETGVYSLDVFTERSSAIKQQMTDANLIVNEIQRDIQAYANHEDRVKQIAPKWESLLTHYWELENEERNYLLKELIVRIDYFKEKRGTKKSSFDFNLKIYPRI